MLSGYKVFLLGPLTDKSVTMLRIYKKEREKYCILTYITTLTLALLTSSFVIFSGYRVQYLGSSTFISAIAFITCNKQFIFLPFINHFKSLVTQYDLQKSIVTLLLEGDPRGSSGDGMCPGAVPVECHNSGGEARVSLAGGKGRDIGEGQPGEQPEGQ